LLVQARVPFARRNYVPGCDLCRRMMPVKDRMTDFLGRSNFLSSGQFMEMGAFMKKARLCKHGPSMFGGNA